MDENIFEQFVPVLNPIYESINKNAALKAQLSKVKQENLQQKEILSYYQGALEKCKISYQQEQENYNNQILNIRNLSKNYETQIKSLSEEKSEITYYRDQIQLIRNEILILQDKLLLLKSLEKIQTNIKPSSKISLLKHQAYKLELELKSYKFYDPEPET
jgi:dTDP-4-amino-4,6-dideoxygalactose transaminase